MKRLALLLITLSLSAPAHAGWSANLGYHNPPGATYGLNFMYLWTEWAFEFGIGHVDKSDSWNKDDDKFTTYSAAGDMNLKYLFGTSSLRPYVQAGFSVGVSTSDSGDTNAGASVSSPFGGVGVFVMGSDAYMYASAIFMDLKNSTNSDSQDLMWQVGLGFPL